MTRERTATWADPAELFAEGLKRSGREYIQAMISGELPHPPICATVGFRITEVGEGRCVIELEPGEHHYNPVGTVHGSVIVAALDSAAGSAVHSTLPAGVGYTTIDLLTTFLRPVHADTGTLRSEGTLVHGGRRIKVADATLVDAEGRLYARATATCMILAP